MNKNLKKIKKIHIKENKICKKKNGMKQLSY